MNFNDRFSRLARKVSRATGSPWASLIAFFTIIVWFIVGFFVGFSDTHQLIINTGTTIITFLMVFLIQASQNHDTDALNLKLDALIKAINEASDEITGAEDMSPDELKSRLRELKDERS
jgi:low affinity Fe/Cu permease